MFTIRNGTAGRLALAAIAILFFVFAAPAAGQLLGGDRPDVSEAPRLDVLQVVDGEVLDSAVIGNRVVLVGSFTQVRNPGGAAINQPYIAAYNINTGAFDSGFRPDLNSEAYAVDTDGTHLYIAGDFTTVDGNRHRKIAKLTAGGDLITSFNPQAEADVDDLAVANGKVYLTGVFSAIDGQPRSVLAAVDAETGEVDQVTNFDFDFSVAVGGFINGKSLAVTPDGSKLFISHTARMIDEQERTAIARFDITRTSTTLSDWQTDLYDDELDRFAGALRPRRIAVSPDGTYFVMTTSGGDRPPAGDTAIRFPVDGGAGVEPDWISRHFDTVHGVAISDEAVYVGGHFQFQEAPGSDDPFPGDPFFNYGFGTGQGPAQLGNQVVAREQLGALNPETGKSLNWNPGSDSFLGPQSLTFVEGHGLLVGHDGERLGGTNIGAHAFFPLEQPVAPAPAPVIDGYACFVEADGNDAVITFLGDRGDSENLLRNGRWVAGVTGADEIRIPGGAGDDFTVRVRGPQFDNPFAAFDCEVGAPAAPAPTPVIDGYACFVEADGNDAVITFLGDRGDSENLLRNGRWVAGVTGADEIRIPGGAGDDFTVRVRGPQFDNPFAAFDCEVGAPAAPAPTPVVTRIDTSITSPFNAEFVDPDAVIVAGEATAPNGVGFVRLAVQRSSDRFYLNADGTYTPTWAPIDVAVNTPDQFATWSIELPITDSGEYSVIARTFDRSRVRDETTVVVRFVVGSDEDDPPEVTVTGPPNPSTGDTAVVSGIVSDDLGVQSVSFTVLETDRQLFLQPDGTLGDSHLFTAALSTPNGTTTGFSRTLTDVPVGDYEVRVEARDTSGQRTFSTFGFGQIGELSPPRLSITSGAGQKVQDGDRLTFAGTAEAEAGIESVEVLLRNTVTWEGVGANGNVQARSGFFILPGTNGETSQNWSYESPDLAPGTYEAIFRVVDIFGATQRATTEVVIGPDGDDLPNATITGSLRFQQGLDTLTLELGGTASDDNGVERVVVQIFDAVRRVWLQTDGTTDIVVDPFETSLDSPGATETAWSFTFDAPQSSRYNFSVRTIDSAGQASSVIVGIGSIFPGDERPTVEVNTPTNNATITTQRISVAGSALDDTSLSAVEVLLRHLETGQYLRSDGSLGAFQWVRASITNPGGSRTNFDYSSPVIPTGEWEVAVRSVDGNGQTSATIVRRRVTLN